MKVLVYFQPNAKHDNFEGARLRKTIKSALEMKNIPYTDTLMGDFDVAHFLYVEDESLLLELKERHIPIIVSALYAESDPEASFLEYKNKDGEKIITVKNKAIKLLEKADLILVPNNTAKTILEGAGINIPIEICPLGVNFSRFDFSRDDEKGIFYRYFSCEKGKTIVISLGDLSLSGFNAYINAAKEYKDANFYYFLKEERGIKLSKENKRILKNLPVNLFLTKLVPDDVYRSALINCDLFVNLDYKPTGIVSISEAMAAKCQIISREQELLKDILVDQKTAYVAEYTETLESIIKDYLDGKLKPTIENAYKEISKNDINAFGDNLIGKYQTLINK